MKSIPFVASFMEAGRRGVPRYLWPAQSISNMIQPQRRLPGILLPYDEKMLIVIINKTQCGSNQRERTSVCVAPFILLSRTLYVLYIPMAFNNNYVIQTVLNTFDYQQGLNEASLL